MYAALKSYLQRDHKKDWQDWLDRIKFIGNYLSGIPTIVSETRIPKGPANAFPSMTVTWNQTKVKITPAEVVKQLLAGKPSIFAGGRDKLSIGVVLLQPEQVEIVAKRVKEILTPAIQ